MTHKQMTDDEQKVRRALRWIILAGIVAFLVLWALPATGPACMDTFSCEAQQ